jgi:ABC-type bacteriocin/lantibiotic exporter with double-glycine peptidase domain
MNNRIKSFLGSNNKIDTPTILQMEYAECGAACLAIIMATYNHFIPLDKLREECGISRDGSKAANLIKAAEKHGFEAGGYKIDLSELSNVEFPVIAHWEFNHFIVIEGLGSEEIFINDPATGPRSIPFDEFSKSFTGVIIRVSPTDKVKKIIPLSTWVKLQVFFDEYKRPIILIILLSFVLSLFSLLQSGFAKVFYDQILLERNYKWFKPFILISFLSGALYLSGLYLQNKHLIALETKFSYEYTIKIFRHLLHLPFTYFLNRQSSDILTRLKAIDRFADVIANGTLNNIINILLLPVLVISMLFINSILAMTVLLFSLLLGMLLFSVVRTNTDYYRRMIKEHSDWTSFSVQAISMMETVKVLGVEEKIFSKYLIKLSKVLQKQIDLYSLKQLNTSLISIETNLIQIAVMGLGGYQIISGNFTIGGLIAFQGLFIFYQHSLTSFIITLSNLQLLTADIDRTHDILLYKRDPKYQLTEHKILNERGKVIIHNLTFGYNPNTTPLFSRLNLIIEPRSRIAFVGRSGSGKSTLMSLLAGLQQPWEGNIIVNGIKLEDINPNLLKYNLSYVNQEIVLFEGSLKDNITMWNEGIPQEIINKSIKDACLDKVVKDRGINLQIGENGQNLSGGERQRVDIARALSLRTPILLLDEATSSLDRDTERELIDNLNSYYDTTFIMSAHRLSTVQQCDIIYVIEKGEIIEFGSHQELLRQKGLYQQLLMEEVIANG